VERLVSTMRRPVGSAALAAEILFRAGQLVEEAFKHQLLADPATLFARDGSRKRTICST